MFMNAYIHRGHTGLEESEACLLLPESGMLDYRAGVQVSLPDGRAHDEPLFP